MAAQYNLSSDEVKNIQSEALKEVNDAFDFAETQPWPNPEDALEEVYVNYPRELLL
jgi:TPP-dependent pyruvate/acetoin dehydrogenase alpha subunit